MQPTCFVGVRWRLTRNGGADPSRRAIGASDYHPRSVRRFAPAIKRLQRPVVHASTLAVPPAADPPPRYEGRIQKHESWKSRMTRNVLKDEDSTMKKAVQLSTITLAIILFLYSQAYSTTADIDKSRDRVKEEIWALEEAYFANLYKADYEAVLAIVHSQFLGWPGTVPQPIDKEGSARFMKQLISKPTSCTFKIERGGIRVLGEVALTQYTIGVNCSDTAAVAKTQSSRITHTWVNEDDRWRLLGGMSGDQ